MRLLYACGVGLTVVGLAFGAEPATRVFVTTPAEGLSAALARVRSQRAAGTAAELRLETGIYRLSETLCFDARDNNLTVCAAPGAHPILDGSRVIGPFVKRADGLYAADVACLPYAGETFSACGGWGVSDDKGVSDLLFRAGEWLTVAREPNAGYVPANDVVSSTQFLFRAAHFRAADFAQEKGLFALGYWRYLWADESYPIMVEGDCWKLIGPPSKAIARLSKNAPFYLCNSTRFLDQDDEWVFDRAAKQVIVRAQPNAVYEMPAIPGPLVTARKVDNLTLKGLMFRRGRANGLVVTACRGFVFKNNDVTQFGNNGLVCQNVSKAEIVGNKFHTFGYMAVQLNGGDRRTLTPSASVFADNDVTDTGLTRRTYSEGILVAGCGFTLTHNLFHDLPTSAMRLDANDLFVASNLVVRCVLESDDQGGIDMFGTPFYRGVRIVHNVFREIGPSKTVTSTCGRAGVRLDDMISGVAIVSNRFEQCGTVMFGAVQIHGGRDNLVEGNVFDKCLAGVSFSRWNQGRWQKGVQQRLQTTESFVASGVWKAHYGDLTQIVGHPDNNTVRRNCYKATPPLRQPRNPPVGVETTNVEIILPSDRELGPRVGVR